MKNVAERGDTCSSEERPTAGENSVFTGDTPKAAAATLAACIHTVDMEEEDLLLCLEHCNHRVFSMSSLPASCPKCQTAISDCRLELPPFRLPSPFSRAQDHPCSVLIKPSKCDFLSFSADDCNLLHVGVTNSKGFVVEFDTDGIHRDRTLEWNRCLTISNLGGSLEEDPDWGEYWDFRLEEELTSGRWSSDSYEEEGRNCLEFVLCFLRSLRLDPLSERAKDKVDFCRQYVLPKTMLAAKYIRLHAKVKEGGGIFAMPTNN